MIRSIFCLVLLLQACSSQAIRCNSHLQAINPAAAKASAESASIEKAKP